MEASLCWKQELHTVVLPISSRGLHSYVLLPMLLALCAFAPSTGQSYSNSMEESVRGAKAGRVSFPKHLSLPSSMNDRLQRVVEPRSLELYRENSLASAFYDPSEIPKSPRQAMEFLSRTWSPASSDFFNLLSSNSLVPHLEDKRAEEHNEVFLEEPETEKNKAQCSGDARLRVDHIWTWLSNGRTAPSVPQRHKPHQSSWMNASHMRAWLSGELLRSLSRGCRKRSKEELRLSAARVHASLSVARLAAAVAGFVANCSLEPFSRKGMDMVSVGGEWDKEMSAVIASAAALVATVCAEAAESVGAHRAHVASVIDTGLATQTSADILALTATAATCLRGAATLKLRAASSWHTSEDQTILAQGAQLPVRTPDGKVQLRMVCIYFKHGKLTLKLGKSYLWRSVTRYKEYRIIDAIEISEEGGLTKDGFYLMSLGTTAGCIQVLFQEQKQYRAWKSSISHLLSDH